MKILIGWDTQDITPDRPVELVGQYYQRISRAVRDPLSVTALAIEQTSAGRSVQTVMVTLDIVYVSKDFLAEVRAAVGEQAPGLDPRMIFLNATHIHSGPAWFVAFRWWAPAAQVMQPAEVRTFFLARVVRAVVNAWNARQPGGVSAASTSATTGFCRRVIYADGRAIMYGETNREDFRGIESGNDPMVRNLYTWDEHDRLTGMVVNAACPAQVMESEYVVSADFFGELRQRIHARFGPQVHLLAQVSAAGCQSPRNLSAQAKDEINYWKEAGVFAIADRLEQAVTAGCASSRRCINREPVYRHTVTDLILPVRRAGLAEYKAACADVERLTRGYPDAQAASRTLFERFVTDTHAREQRQPHGPFDNKELEFVQLENALAVIRRHESQEQAPTFAMEMHAIRLGDCAFVTNPFELFLDYGQMIQARSRAKQTFIVELAGDVGRYVPTERAVAAGGYSSLIINGTVGPAGGQLLVEASVAAINQFWNE